MHTHKSPLGRLVALALLLTVTSGPAFAYIDPNAGGMLFQLLAPLFAAVVGGWLFLRRWIVTMARELWSRLTGRDRE
jgi:hypothetical protein